MWNLLMNYAPLWWSFCWRAYVYVLPVGFIISMSEQTGGEAVGEIVALLTFPAVIYLQVLAIQHAISAHDLKPAENNFKVWWSVTWRSLLYLFGCIFVFILANVSENGAIFAASIPSLIIIIVLTQTLGFKQGLMAHDYFGDADLAHADQPD